MPYNPFTLALEPPAKRMAVGLAKLGLVLRSQAWRQAARRGVTPTQAQILAILRLSPGGLRLSEVADRLAVTAATASEAVAALARKGLVRKTRAHLDPRAVSITLTRSGRREVDHFAGWPDILLEAVDTLSPTEQGILLRGLVKMIRTLQDRRQIPVSQMCVTCRFFRPNVHTNPKRPHHCMFVDAPFGDRHLRLDCPDHQSADALMLAETWHRFVAAGP